MKRGQIFTWDLVFSTMIFLVLLLIVLFIWDSALVDITSEEESYEMDWLAKTVTKTLVMTPGVPEGWSSGNVVVYGLGKTVRMGDSLSTLSHVTDPDKFMYFVYDAAGDYEKTRRKLLSSSKYDYYVEFGCLNESSVDCFQGVKLDTINFDISCNNPYVFTIRDYTTDTYKWLEAEDLWGNVESVKCGLASEKCSNMQGSLVSGSPGEKEVETNPGVYRVWVRCLQDPSGFSVVLDGVESPVGCNIDNGLFNWSNFGEFNLSDRAMIRFNRTVVETEVDAVLLTTNLGYDPGVKNAEYLGNPNFVKKCVVGKISGNVRNAVSGTQTASFAEPVTDLELLSGNQPYLPRTIKVRTVIWTQGP